MGKQDTYSLWSRVTSNGQQTKNEHKTSTYRRPPHNALTQQVKRMPNNTHTQTNKHGLRTNKLNDKCGKIAAHGANYQHSGLCKYKYYSTHTHTCICKYVQ